jgi:hypothetical protein
VQQAYSSALSLGHCSLQIVPPVSGLRRSDAFWSDDGQPGSYRFVRRISTAKR